MDNKFHEKKRNVTKVTEIKGSRSWIINSKEKRGM